EKRDGIDCRPKGKAKLQLRCERENIRTVRYIEIRYDAENALFFLLFHLLGRDLYFRGCGYLNCGSRGRNSEADACQNLGLARRDRYLWRSPICESCPADNYKIRNSRPDIVELEKSIVICYCRM